MDLKHVDGEDKGKLMLFALSTCGWCKKTRMYLEDIGAEYNYIYVDLTSGDERNEAVTALEKFNPDVSFPTLVINDTDVIIGFKEDEIQAKIG